VDRQGRADPTSHLMDYNNVASNYNMMINMARMSMPGR